MCVRACLRAPLAADFHAEKACVRRAHRSQTGRPCLSSRLSWSATRIPNAPHSPPTACARAEWDYQTQIARLRNGTLAAVIADDTILVPEANTAPDCALHVLNDLIEPYDLALGFRRTFDNDAFRDAVDLELLRLLESGRLAVRYCRR